MYCFYFQFCCRVRFISKHVKSDWKCFRTIFYKALVLGAFKLCFSSRQCFCLLAPRKIKILENNFLIEISTQIHSINVIPWPKVGVLLILCTYIFRNVIATPNTELYVKKF